MSDSPICVDASVVVRFVVGGPAAEAAGAAWALWLDEGREVVAPELLLAETTSVLHRYRHQGLLSDATVREALDTVLALPIRLVRGPAVHRRALTLAGELGLSAAYDTHYLAVTEQEAAQFWTADRKLVAAAGNRFPHIQLLG